MFAALSPTIGSMCHTLSVDKGSPHSFLRTRHSRGTNAASGARTLAPLTPRRYPAARRLAHPCYAPLPARATSHARPRSTLARESGRIRGGERDQFSPRHGAFLPIALACRLPSTTIADARLMPSALPSSSCPVLASAYRPCHCGQRLALCSNQRRPTPPEGSPATEPDSRER